MLIRYLDVSLKQDYLVKRIAGEFRGLYGVCVNNEFRIS